MKQTVINKKEVFDIINGDLSFDIPVSEPTNDPALINWKPSEIRSFLKRDLSQFQQNVLYIKESFYEAVVKSKDAILGAIHKDADYMYDHLRYKSAVLLDETSLSSFYTVNADTKTITFLVTIGKNAAFGVCNQSLVQDRPVSDTKFYLNPSISYAKHDETMIHELNATAFFGLMTSFFRSYADHEIKTVQHKASAKVNGSIYKNMNKRNVLVLDSSWYTSLVRTEGFLVRGHLRMQACGTGFSERKLIYIDSFEKNGYVRKAKMLPQHTPGISYINQTI